MKIVVDAMGSDRNPVPDVEGAVMAAREFSESIVLVGDRALVERELAKYDTAGLLLEVVHAPQAITMDDKPSVVGRAKPESSMHIGTRLIKEGQADAFVTAGNTGAALAVSTLLTLKRIPGVHRPALTTVMRIQDVSFIMLDIGANVDCKPEWMLQFAVMGSVYAERVLGRERPRVGLLSNGEEESKGTVLVQQSAELLRNAGVNLIGNVEPKDILQGRADVAVMDGFSGNVMLKSMEAFGSAVFELIRQEFRRDLRSKIGGVFGKPAFRRVYRVVDPFEIGGAPLLGVNGVVIIGHGRSNAVAIKNAIGQARAAVTGGIVSAIREGLGSLETQE